MSRIGKKEIVFPKGVKVSIADGQIHAEGPKGKLSSPIPEGITANLEDGRLNFSRSSEDGPIRAKHGLARALANNCVVGACGGRWRSRQCLHEYRTRTDCRPLLTTIRSA